MKVSYVHGHDHTWNPGDAKTSFDKGHSHTVKHPESGSTDSAMQHTHELPKSGKLAAIAKKKELNGGSS